MVTDNTRQEIGREIRKIEPAINMGVDYIDVPDSNGLQLIVLHVDKSLYSDALYVFDGKPYYKLESTTMLMPQTMYNDMLRRRDSDRFHWDTQICDSHTIADLDESLIRRVVRSGISNGRIHASAAEDTIQGARGRRAPLPHEKKVAPCKILIQTDRRAFGATWSLKNETCV